MADGSDAAGGHTNVMQIEELSAAIVWQAEHAEQNGAPCTARIVRSLNAVALTDTATGRKIANWEGLSLKDAMPLRIAGGFHHLVLTGADDRLQAVYAGALTDQDQIDQLVVDIVQRFDERLLPWLEGPPQTNEAGRSASIMAGLVWLSSQLGPRFELFELGASAGVITMLDRYRFDLGGVQLGQEQSPMQIAPEWRGSSPPDNPVEIMSVKGCDVAPINLADADAALRLKSYVWPEVADRMERIDAAIALAAQSPPDVVQMDAGKFVEGMLASSQPAGVTRVMFHSIMWQYMPVETQRAITEAMEQTGENADADHPLAWVSLETDPATFRHELRVRFWPGGAKQVCLSHAHPHGAWVEWSGA
ncbi:MAG: DUF2332 domain-containing protein [Erythrobacter sp.]